MITKCSKIGHALLGRRERNLLIFPDRGRLSGPTICGTVRSYRRYHVERQIFFVFFVFY